MGSIYGDTLTGDDSVNRLEGGNGDDTLTGGGGADRLEGGTGNDTVIYSGSPGGVTVNLATGAVSGGDAQGDTISGFENVTGSAHNDVLTGDRGANVLAGGAGAEPVEWWFGNRYVVLCGLAQWG